MTNNLDNPTGLSASTLEEVDRICLEFEQAWQRHERPAIGDYVRRGSHLPRSDLLRELLLLDIDYRRSSGKPPSLAEYVTEFPDDKLIVQAAIAAPDHETVDRRARQPAESTHYVPTGEQSAPSHVGRYRIEQRIGVGGFGAVYKAYDDRLQRWVAIKVPNLGRFTSDEARGLFLKEARSLATLRHPAIVPVHDAGFIGEKGVRNSLCEAPEEPFRQKVPDSFFEASFETCYVVSDFMGGGNLADFVAGDRLSPIEAARIATTIAEALHYAHGKGLVHRDVKLSNILRDADGNVYIADFGMALRDEDVGTGAGFAGTPTNMSPEQARGEGHLVDGRADIYGLGVVLYELLSGQRPFAGKDVPSLLEQIALREPKPPRQIDDQIPKDLERICLKALSKRPADRYSTAMDMADDLRCFDDQAQSLRWTGTHNLWAASLAVATLVVMGWMTMLRVGPEPNAAKQLPAAASMIRSLAILPFTSATEDESATYLGLGMADTLITKLSNLRQIVVRPTAAVRAYLQQSGDPIAAGRTLRVDAVLEGSIQQAADQTRTSVRLLRVADGQSLWAATFDESSVDLFSLQNVISAHVAKALVLQLTAEEQERLEHPHTEDRDAYEAYTKGRYHWNQRVVEGPLAIRRAIQYFREAINADPLYALAYAGLAESYALMNVYAGRLDEQAFPRARAAAQRALEIDPKLTEAHATLAFVMFYHDWDWDGAEQEFRRAIELNPNYATAYQWYGELLYFSMRYDESIVQLKRAANLDPLSPTICALQGTPYLWRRDYLRARQEYQKSLEAHPRSVLALYGMAVCYQQQQQFEKVLEVSAKQGSPQGQAYALAKLGREDEARQILNDLLQWGPHPAYPYSIAQIHLGLGEFDKAFEWLEKARLARDEHMVWLQVDPKLDPIRDDPRFVKLLKDVGWVK